VTVVAGDDGSLWQRVVVASREALEAFGFE